MSKNDVCLRLIEKLFVCIIFGLNHLEMTNKRVIRKWYSVIQSALLPILESWSGQKLSKDAIIYGVRRYYR